MSNFAKMVGYTLCSFQLFENLKILTGFHTAITTNNNFVLYGIQYYNHIVTRNSCLYQARVSVLWSFCIAHFEVDKIKNTFRFASNVSFFNHLLTIFPEFENLDAHSILQPKNVFHRKLLYIILTALHKQFEAFILQVSNI